MGEDLEYADVYKEDSKDKIDGKNYAYKDPEDIENIYKESLTEDSIKGENNLRKDVKERKSEKAEIFKSESKQQINLTAKHSLNALIQEDSILSNKPKMKLSSKNNFADIIPKEVSSGLKEVKQDSILSNKRRSLPTVKTNTDPARSH